MQTPTPRSLLVGLVCVNIMAFIVSITVLLVWRWYTPQPEEQFQRVMTILAKRPAEQARIDAIDLLKSTDWMMRYWRDMTCYATFTFTGLTIMNLGFLGLGFRASIWKTD
jgi:hypothetical protein